MTGEIAREKWGDFFDSLTRERKGWITNVQVLSAEAGAQVLSERLPFVGLTFESDEDPPRVELAIGTDPDAHQTHNFFDPQIIALNGDDENAPATLDIEEANGTKTLITFVESAGARSAGV